MRYLWQVRNFLRKFQVWYTQNYRFYYSRVHHNLQKKGIRPIKSYNFRKKPIVFYIVHYFPHRFIQEKENLPIIVVTVIWVPQTLSGVQAHRKQRLIR